MNKNNHATGTIYSHTQESSLMKAILLVSTFYAAVVFTLTDIPIFVWLLVPVLAVISVIFSSLTVVVGSGNLTWHFGLGFWKKSILITDIASVETVKNSWWFGWGIRMTPHGWLYNVAGLDAVEITVHSGKKVRIGTDDKDRLQNAIMSLLQE